MQHRLCAYGSSSPQANIRVGPCSDWNQSAAERSGSGACGKERLDQFANCMWYALSRICVFDIRNECRRLSIVESHGQDRYMALRELSD